MVTRGYDTLVQSNGRSFSQWVTFKNQRLFVACCDCGLVHEWQIGFKRNRVYLRTRRAKQRTKDRRRCRKKS